MTFTAAPLFPGLLNDSALRLAEDGGAWTDALAMGWPSVLVDPAHGGSGGTLSDVGAVVEGLARHGLSLPVIERCAAVPHLLQSCAAEDAGARDLLARVSDGRASVCLLLPQEAAAHADAPWPRAARRGDTQVRLDGPALQCDAAQPLTHALIPVRQVDDDGASRPALLLVEWAALQASARSFRSADDATVWHLPIDGLTVDGVQWLAHGDAVTAALAQARTLSMLLVGVDTVSAIGALIEQSIAHLHQRVQFGVALSTFQVLRHKVVDIYVMYEAARGLVDRGIRLAEHDLAATARDAALIKLYTARAGRFAAETAIQLHGAIGMSDELPAARLARRLVTNEFRHGDRLRHGAALAADLSAHITNVW